MLNKNSRKALKTIFNLKNSCADLLLVACLLPSMRRKRIIFSKLPAFSYQLESHTGKLIWLFKTSMHPTFTCAMPCPHSGRWYSVNVLRELDHLKQHDSVSPADWSHAAPAQHNKPPACVLDRCVAASLMHACNYNTSPSVCVLGGET